MKSNEDSMKKIFSVIEYMSTMERKLSIQEISAALDLSTATVYRILTGLKSMGYVEQHANKQYYLTYKLYQLSGDVINRDDAIDKIIPIMNYLSRRYGCEVGLAAFHEMSIIHIISVGENISFGTLYPMPGQTFSSYCTAAGKLFLAQMEPDALVEWLARERIVPHTRNTIIDRDELLREIDRTRAQGYGVVVGELYDLIACVAFPVHDGSGAITGTLNLSFTVEDFKRHMGEDFVKEVEDTLKSFGI